MPTVTDYLQQPTAGLPGLLHVVPGVWVKLVNNATGTPYVSVAASDANGAWTYIAPAGDYTVYTGPTATGPWASAGDGHYQVPPSDGLLSNVPDDSLPPQFTRGISTSTLPNWFKKLASDPVNAKVAFVGDSTSIEPGTSLFARLRSFHTAVGEGLGGMVGDTAHIISGGNNGQSCTSWITNVPGTGYTYSQLLADAPDLVVFSFGLNDVRTGISNLAALTADLTTAVHMIRRGLPNTDIVLRMPPSLTTDDVNGNGWVVPNSSAQAYTDIMRNAYLSLVNRWPNVVVWDAMNRVFGPICRAKFTGSYGLMFDQLHPSQFGYNQIDDDLVANVIGYFPPMSRDKAYAAMIESPTTPWTVYPRVVEHPDFFSLIAEGDFDQQGSNYLYFHASGLPTANAHAARKAGLNFSGARAADIQAGDVVQLGRDTVFRIPGPAGMSSLSSGDAAYPKVTLTNLGTSKPSNSVTSGTVRVWRETGSSDGLLAAILKSTQQYQFLRIGRVAAAGVNPQIIAISGKSAQWNVLASDQLYVATYPSNPISLAAIGIPHNGDNLWLNSSPNLDAYDGMLAIIVGSHPGEVLKDHASGTYGGGIAVAAGTVPAQYQVDVAVTVTGAIFSGGNLPVTGVIAQPRAAITAGVLWHAWVTATDTVTVRFINPTAAGIVVGTVNFDFWLVR
jgi:lysophospholipase L1-like esterase